MNWTQSAIGSCAFAISTIWFSGAYSNLGDTLSQAKVRGEVYEAEFGAAAPLFDTDSNGKVNWECWAAPPEQWTKDQAMEFARKLIPKTISSISPKEGELNGIREPYFYPDGTVVILQVADLGINGVRESYFGVEVFSPSYTGPNC